MNKFRFIDLFAGIGGFHIALEKLGGTCVFASEIQPHLQDLYELNFGIRPKGDIKAINASDIPSHDFLCAGFPCQPFSKAGEQLGFECSRQGDLFFNVESILKEKKPSFFILENVPNLLKHDDGRTFAHIKLSLENLGYEVAVNRFSPHHFGIPQIRERVYIVGAKSSLNGFEWPPVTNKETSIVDVLEDNPVEAKRLSQQAEKCLSTWDDFLQTIPKEIEIPSFPIWSMEFGATYPFEDETPFAILSKQGTRGLAKYKGSHGLALNDLPAANRWAALPSHARKEQVEFPKWKIKFIRQNRKFYEENSKWINPWLNKILEFPSSLQKFEWNAHGGERDIWKYVLQFRASGVRVKRPTTAPSLIAMTDSQVPIIGWQKRYMTPHECAKLQSLGSINLPSRQSQAFHALGNAVNSDVVEAIATKLIKIHAPKSILSSADTPENEPMQEIAA